MADDQAKPSGPDLAKGIAFAELADGGMLAGHVGEEQVLLVRVGQEVFATAAHCSHYHGPLADGLVVGDTVRCPWHHACFSLRTGEALRAPALSPIDCWSVEQRDGKVFVTAKRTDMKPAPRGKPASPAPDRVVIVGGGAAGFAAAEMLRRQDYKGGIVMLSSDDAPPVDRPNLSKDYLAGTAPEEWIPLRGDDFYADNAIDLRLQANVTAVDPRAREVSLADGGKVAYDRLLLATGAEPVRLQIPGAELPHVHTLRSLADSRAIVALAKTARRAVVIGASFIGLEAAAALRARKIEVHVVAPETRPMERILGSEMGDFVRALHEADGGHLSSRGQRRCHRRQAGEAEERRHASKPTSSSWAWACARGSRWPRRRVSPSIAGSRSTRFWRPARPAVFAAGDIARWPDPHCGQAIRVEHWVVAERQGQTAALNMLGLREKFDAVPFFWSQHYDVPINYVGHAEKWDELAIEGDIAGKDCLLRFKLAGRTLAVASIYRDLASLQAEVAMEKERAV